MIKVRQTEVFTHWMATLRDQRARQRIAQRLHRLGLGNPGQQRVLKGAVCEMKIDYGPGYRVYYTQRGETLIVLLCGGDKRTQQADIRTATRMAQEV